MVASNFQFAFSLSTPQGRNENPFIFQLLGISGDKTFFLLFPSGVENPSDSGVKDCVQNMSIRINQAVGALTEM